MAPCFNEAAVLREFHRRVRQSAERWSRPTEIVFVDDGSTDESFALLLELAREPEVVVARLLRNHGHQPAATASLSIARGERVLLIDADLQDPP